MRQMKKKIIIAIIVTLILTAGIAFVLSNLALSAKDKEISELKVKIADSKCLAFASDLKADSIITQSDVKVVDMKRTSIASGGYYYKDGGWKYYTSFVDENGTSQESNQAYANVEKIKESLVGRVVKANVSANTPVLDSLLYPEAEEPTKDERILEFNFLKLPSDLVENEYVDIRIRFPNGEDYSVLIGKKVGDIVDVPLPVGEMTVKIVKVD